MKTHRKANIAALNKVIQNDEFDDLAKHKAMGFVYADDMIEFIERNLLGEHICDVGCGSGASFKLFPITHAVEANPRRHALAAKHKVDVKLGAAEALPFDAEAFDTILHLQGFFQVRSDWEAMIEYNRALRLKGRFIFDFPSARQPIVFGRTYAGREYVETLCDFGFRVVEYRELESGFDAVCMEKVENWNPDKMRKPQIAPSTQPGLWLVKNIDTNSLTWR